MQFKQLIALTYAITAAGLAIGLTSNYLRTLQAQYSNVKPTEPAEIEMSSVLTVARAIVAGKKLSAADFIQTPWPADAVPPGALRTLKDVFAKPGDKFSRSALVEGEVMLPAKISATGSGSALSMMLPAGMRAVTIKINEVRGVGGFVQPNDTVDILLTETQSEEEKPRPRSSRVILQNIRILAMGQDVRKSDNQPKVARSATVAVTLEDAQKLALATTIGQISFALRNPDQKSTAGMREISLKDLQLPDKKRRVLRSGKMEVVVHRAGGAAGEPAQRLRRKYSY